MVAAVENHRIEVIVIENIFGDYTAIFFEMG